MERTAKQGTLTGVFIPNFLQMAGVIVFLRMGWILGHVGPYVMTLVIAFASSLLLVTSLSLSSILSNMKMEGGGGYYLFSRILGIEIGSALGLLLTVMQIATISLCVSGFAVSIQELLPTYSIEWIKILSLCGLTLLAFTRFALKTQWLIFIALLTGLTSLFLGREVPPAASVPASLSFWTAFALFFPATTGIEAGMSLSGDLKKPNHSIPKGTLLSVACAFLLYLSLTGFFTLVASRDVLRSHPNLIFSLALNKPLIYAGVLGTILSSALSNLMGAPRILTSIAKDNVLPSSFQKIRTSTLYVFSLALVLTLITDLGHLIPMLSMICLSSYALINFVAFFEEFLQKPSWRPTFRVHWTVSLIGSLLCFFAMFMINAGAAFLVICLVIALCIWTASRRLEGNWDDIRHSLLSFLIQKGTNQLAHVEANPKSWRPHLLTLLPTGQLPKHLAHFAHALDQEKGLLTFATSSLNLLLSEDLKSQLASYQIPAHVHVNPSPPTEESLEQIIKNYGYGPLLPNTILLPFCPPSTLYPLLLHARTFQKNILILKDLAPSSPTKTIHLWWRGQNQKNFELCLALSYILQCSPEWKGAKITIQSLVPDQKTQVKLSSLFERAQERLRMQGLTFHPIIAPPESFFSYLQKDALKTNLTFLGLKMPEENETEYETYLSKIFSSTEDLPNLAYVLAGEEIDFQNIFTN